ncbi:MAG: DUF2795 domain-containing protein [Methanoculleus sp.]|nr:DUF2795 domain-containing protein [Methanoculleus sp. YWC-01]MCK9297774.1 DUF2795 domain-containing protein [Methanoculleus sp.]
MAERQAGSMLETRPRREETVDLMRAHDIRDIKVRNPEGENLGDISDIAIDRDSGCVAYAVLSYGGILGFGEKHFAIPWEAVRTRPGERSAVVDADKRTLDTTHGFARDRMPREGDWSLIRTSPPARAAAEPAPPVTEREVPPPREAGTAAAATGAAVTGAAAAGAAAERTPPGRERAVPTPPGVQTVAGGWGGQPTGQRVEERPVTTEAPPREPGVKEVQRERTGGMETRPRETVVEEVRREEPVETVTPPRETIVEEVRRERPAEMETRPVTEAERPTTTPGPAPGHLSAAGLQTYLKGMDYPAGRQDLIAHARKNQAPESVITVLEGFSDRSYRSAAEVSEEFGSEIRGGRPARAETIVEEVREEPPVTRTGAPSLAHLSAADLQVYLKGMDYPAGRQDLMNHARKNNAPENVITTLEGFSDRTYRSAADVSTEFGRETRGEQPVGMETRRETVVEEVREEPPVARRTGSPSLAHLSAADLQTYLKGMDYPAGKQDLITHARKNNAPENVIAAIEMFGDRTYQSATDVSTEFGNVK